MSVLVERGNNLRAIFFSASSYEITFWFETQEATTLGYLGELQVKRKISVSRGKEDGGRAGLLFPSAARFGCATSRTARCALGTFPFFRKGPASEDREAEVEEDGSKPDTRFVRRVYPVERERERERVGSSCLPQRGCSLALAVSSSVFDFALTCRHYAIRFGQPPVEKAPSWSWISITVVMATAIDSTGVRVDGEENGFHRAPARKLGRIPLIHVFVDLLGVAFG
ncbi:hypothetical protein ALC56_11613 [Trachymyrmex septentrionalis]|uniref:Uncharacterized protein n=1 Tax=Trachymyrmex septentrionalis TaxID=34720 RepID=A0A195F0V9_9HYME|nr:hypothetical protein ALC56_11613 [Trachymyrmex septentrionalis]